MIGNKLLTIYGNLAEHGDIRKIVDDIRTLTSQAFCLARCRKASPIELRAIGHILEGVVEGVVAEALLRTQFEMKKDEESIEGLKE